MVRRIVKCSSCLKRFATASGQGQCPSCRSPPKSNHNGIVSSAAAKLEEHETAALQSQKRPPVQDDYVDDSSQTNQVSSWKKRKQQSATTEDDVVAVSNNVATTSPIKPAAVDENDTVNFDSDIEIIHTNKAPAEDMMSKKLKTSGDDESSKIISSSSKCAVPKLFDDHGEIITDGSNTDFKEGASNPLKGEMGGEGSWCGSENDDLLDMECMDIDENGNTANDDEASQSRGNRNDHLTENDVCYICGTNLSCKGLKSRVAHMKRCSTKYGQAMKTSNDEVEDIIMAPFKSLSKPVVSNPYTGAQWHGGADKTVQHSKEKQSMLHQFLKAPVRSLTNVLMAGARQASKKKVETSSLQKGLKSAITTDAGKKTSYRKGSWSSNNRRGGQCPSFKKIPGTDFLCDGFYYAGSLTQNYFLTHFHSDHYGGITKKWNDGIIYCSLPTANLVHQNLGVEQKYLHPLPMNEPTTIFSKDKEVKVTPLDANHCPGAVMFLFELGNRRILHVGDFRWNRNIMLDIPQIRALSTMSPRLDELYLDTTYCNPKYELPTQEEAIAAAIEVASEEMEKSKRGSRTLFLFGSYTIGKEKIYLSVARHLKQKVYVDSQRLRILKALDWPNERMSIFTTKKDETCLWVVPLGKVNFKEMPDFLEQANKHKVGKALSAKYDRVVGFRPTGWTYTTKDKKQTLLPCGQPKPSHLISSKTNGKFSVHGVPYSEHSSFPELVDCVRCLKPKKIVTTVSPSKSDEQIELLLNAVNC